MDKELFQGSANKPTTASAIVTVDVIVVRSLQRGPEILLIQRGNPPFQGLWALPGGKLDDGDATLEGAAVRELREETGLVLPSVLRLKQLGAFGDRGRDPRPGRLVSVVFYAPIIHLPRWQVMNSQVRAGDDAADARWFSVYEYPPLAFDHQSIVEQAFVPGILHIDRRFR